jgi:hypothetical protein
MKQAPKPSKPVDVSGDLDAERVSVRQASADQKSGQQPPAITMPMSLGKGPRSSVRRGAPPRVHVRVERGFLPGA